MDILPLDCDCGSEETEHRNICIEDINGVPTEVEYSLYCKQCGRYLGSFVYGHWEY